MSEIKLDKIISLQETTIRELNSLQAKITNIENRLKENEKESKDIANDCARNSTSIKYQWWIITFI